MSGTVYVVPVINTMGPVVDPRHDDLLNTWDDVDRCTARYFDPTFRNRFPDSRGGPAVFSWFFISWSGFTSNPVHRDFGWFTIFDHYRHRFGVQMERWGDELFWMYNHPPASGVGNEWGMDWLQNTHYLEVLNRYLIDRRYFPSVVEIPTERNDTSNWIEQWFPFDVGNRNCRDLNLGAVEADGKMTGTVLDWSLAPDDWSEYHPDPDDYRVPGSMQRTVFRLLDIKTRIYQLREEEIEKAFVRAEAGKDTFLAAYEHDFRDRSQAVADLLLEPVTRVASRHPGVEWRYANALEAAQRVTAKGPDAAPGFTLTLEGTDLQVAANGPLFGPMPYVAVKDLDAESYQHVPVALVGRRVWRIARGRLPEHAIVAAAAASPGGAVGTERVELHGDLVVPARLGD